jgi:hypothetical protein
MLVLLMPTCPNAAGADQSPELSLSYENGDAHELVSEPLVDGAWCSVVVACWCLRCATLGEDLGRRT